MCMRLHFVSLQGGDKISLLNICKIFFPHNNDLNICQGASVPKTYFNNNRVLSRLDSTLVAVRSQADEQGGRGGGIPKCAVPCRYAATSQERLIIRPTGQQQQ